LAETLNQNDHVIHAIQYFDELIEDAQKYHDKWLQDETTEHLRQQKDDLRKLKSHPKSTDKIDNELSQALKNKLQINTNVKPTPMFNIPDSSSESDLYSDDETQVKENLPAERTEDDLFTSVLYKLVKVAKCTGIQCLKDSTDLRK
jgi:hypothetical protein